MKKTDIQIVNDLLDYYKLEAGEFNIIAGRNIPYQDYDSTLAEKMRHILSIQSDEKYLVCLPDVFEGIDRYTQGVIDFWEGHLKNNKGLYLENCKQEWYGSAFLSRPYIDLKDKGPGEYDIPVKVVGSDLRIKYKSKYKYNL